MLLVKAKDETIECLESEVSFLRHRAEYLRTARRCSAQGSRAAPIVGRETLASTRSYTLRCSATSDGRQVCLRLRLSFSP